MTGRVGDWATRPGLRPGVVRRLALISGAGRRIRRKPRTEEQSDMLRHMALVSIRQRVESGRLERIGPREYILHPHGIDRGAPGDAQLPSDAGTPERG